MATKPSVFYHHEQYDAYECMGCNEMLETPASAILKNGHKPVSVKNNAENRLIWLELMAKSHSMCSKFFDSRMAEQMREFHLRPKGDDGPLRNMAPARA